MENPHQNFLKRINIYLFLLLLLMIAFFFTWSENIIITRAIKVFGRMGIMLASIMVYQKIINHGAVNSLNYKNNFSLQLYLGYLGLGFISFAWSTNPGFSALQWIMVVQSLVFAYFFVKSLKLLDIYFEGNNIKLFRLLGNSVFVIQTIFIIGMFVSPEVFFRLTDGGTEARLGGTMMNPNELGMLAGVGIACLLFDMYGDKNKVTTIFKILIILWALYMTGSRSSLVGVFLIIFFHIKQTKSKVLKFGIITGVIAIIPFAVYQIILKGGDETRLNEVLSLTGRLPFWSALITEGLPREPFFGFGFMRIDYKEFFQSVHTYPGKMTHNTFLQVLMNLGFVGFLIVLFQVFFTLKAIISEKKENQLMFLGIIIPIMINSFTEFGVFGESNYGILFYQIIIFYISFENRKYLTTFQQISLKKKRPELFLKIV